MSVFAGLALSQSETGKASLDGRVSDPSGKVLQGAEITVLETNTGFRRKVTTNGEGEFRLSAMPVGTYRVEASAAGFGTSRLEDLALTVGETKSLNLTLQISAISSQVTVLADAVIVNQSDPSNATTIGARAIEDLPIRGRAFTEFIQLTPNVMQEGNRYGIVVNGQRSINVSYAVDGADFTDSLQGGQRGGGPNESAFFFPQLGIREFQVVRDGATAEVGRTNAGFVNVVTKSGTNDPHGAGFYANRNGAMTSLDAFGNDSSSNAQSQFGGSAGGAIKKDRLFYFGAVEKNIVTIPYFVKFNTPSIAIPADIAAQQGEQTQKNNPLVAFGRVDYQINNANNINLQYTYAAQSGLNFGGASGQTNQAVTNNTYLDRASQGVKVALSTVLSPNLVNEVRGQWAYDNRIKGPFSQTPQIDINDLGTLGGAKGGTEIYRATRYQVLDNVNWNKGRHAIKFGVDLNFNPQQQQRETNYGGLYTFNTLADYLAALKGDKTKIAQYQQSIAANGTQGFYDQMQQDYAAFITDSIKVRRDLTITAGIRWAGQVNPQPTTINPKYPIYTGSIPNDLHSWQPRLGIAYDFGGKGVSVLRASAGLFTSRTPGYLMQRVFTDNGLNTLVLDTKTDASVFNLLTVPNAITSLPAGIKTPVNLIYAFDPSFRNPVSGQMAISLEQKIDKNTKVTIGFTRNSTWKLQRRVDTNLFAPTTLSNGLAVYPTFDANKNVVQASGFNATTGLPIFVDSTGKTLTAAVARPDSTIGALNVNKSVGHSEYNGTSISVQRRMSRHLQFGFNYTYAFNRDDDSNERDFNRQTAYNTFDLTRDASYSKNDIRHSGNMNILYDLGKGFTISTLLFARTGTIVKPVTGQDAQNDGNTTNDRPVINGQVVPRDYLRQPGFFDWDMRLLKEFRFGEKVRLSFSIEGFNLTRSSNKGHNGDGETQSFGKPQATVNPNTGFFYSGNSAGVATFSPGTDRFGGARQGQLGVRVVF